ncbi:TetR family transcriptional regulator [Microbacterium elymi]|uniref:TetR family transcriptional regulator n=1 Tax=Microbacterium elymi TaxID=2909587 RepID=A0ABY5NN63_9MICO|nr:TetR family transcriptional regulator [Microbacterium elymi]
MSHIALELFLANGFDETTVDEIARAARIGRRTFFRYYASKNDLAWAASTNSSRRWPPTSTRSATPSRSWTRCTKPSSSSIGFQRRRSRSTASGCA